MDIRPLVVALMVGGTAALAVLVSSLSNALQAPVDDQVIESAAQPTEN
jgi:hypothetical protein